MRQNTNLYLKLLKPKIILTLYNLNMTIYIESFLIQNTLINFCLLRLVKLCSKPKGGFVRLLLASVSGALINIFALLFKTSILINLFKFIALIVMVIVAFNQTKKQFAFNLILLFIFEFSFLGAITAIFGKTIKTNMGFLVASKIKLETITIICIALTYVFELVITHINFKIKTSNLIYPITLHLNNKKITINAYLDTGNFLNYNNEPVVLIDMNSFLKLSNLDLLNSYLTNSNKICLNTVAGKKFINIFKIDLLEITINNKKKQFIKPYIAVNNSNAFKNTNYQALLTPQFL